MFRDKTYFVINFIQKDLFEFDSSREILLMKFKFTV